jgi:hypothetical protein
MTLAEKLAQKKRVSAGIEPGATPVTPAPTPGIILSGEPEAEALGTAGTSMATGRRLAWDTEGEHIPMRHENDGLDPGWFKLVHSLETELCIVIGPNHKDEAWIGVLPKGPTKNAPLLFMKFPLVILPGTFAPY